MLCVFPLLVGICPWDSPPYGDLSWYLYLIRCNFHRHSPDGSTYFPCLIYIFHRQWLGNVLESGISPPACQFSTIVSMSAATGKLGLKLRNRNVPRHLISRKTWIKSIQISSKKEINNENIWNKRMKAFQRGKSSLNGGIMCKVCSVYLLSNKPEALIRSVTLVSLS